MLTSQVLSYFGLTGLSMNTPLKNLEIFLSCPILPPLINEIADLIEFNDPYAAPSSKFFVRNRMTSSPSG